jgi:hypothetical protein
MYVILELEEPETLVFEGVSTMVLVRKTIADTYY